MPISEEQWEELSPIDSYSHTLLSFFEENPSKAYSAQEIMNEHSDLTLEENGLSYAIVLTYYRSLLDYLSSESQIDERELERENEEGETEYVSYYRAKTAERDQVQ